AGVRSKDRAGRTERMRRLVIALARANSRRPSGPWMRPNPEAPTPPNGRLGIPANEIAELTHAKPGRRLPARPLPPPPPTAAAPQAVRAAVGALARLVGVAHPGHGQRGTERLLLHGRAVLGHVDQDRRLYVRRRHRLRPAQHGGAAALQSVVDVPADDVDLA